jgi:4-amino-4-deoxy-L-arabinose transferase-like glycosyltransferase
MIANSNHFPGRDAEAPDRGLRLALLIVGAGLLLRIAILPFRWVNPDEGAHLMDARLLLEGLVPLVDYGARQPFYVLLLAGWVRVVGADHTWARVLPMLAGSATAVLVFLLARRLFGRMAALWAVGLMTFYPFMVIWSTIVHTQPFTLVLCTLALYLVTRHLQEGGAAQLVIAGVAFGLAFYVRESSLAPLLAAGILLLAYPDAEHRRPGRAVAVAALAAGFALVAVSGMALYSHWLGLGGAWASNVNPLGIVRDGIGAVVGVLSHNAAVTAPSDAARTAEPFRDPTQDWSETFGYLRTAARLNAPFLAALAAAPVLLLGGVTPERRRDLLQRLAVPLAWVGSLVLLYGYWLVRRGFYPQYALEFLPPLILVAAAALDRFARSSAISTPAFATMVIALFALVALGHRIGVMDLSNVALVGAAAVCVLAATGAEARRPAVLALAVLALVAAEVASARLGHGRGALASAAKLGLVVAAVTVPAVPWLRRTAAPAWPRLGAFFLLAVTGLSAAAASGRALSLAYECVWAPGTVRAVTRALASRAGAGDRVLSGGVIWEFDAGLRPVADISHPLSFASGIPAEDEARLDRALRAGDPRFIVLDGYTEQTYLPYSPALERALSTRYRLVGRFAGSEYPVELYMRAN